jgi:general L-amino acid transport system substrate-binding protein
LVSNAEKPVQRNFARARCHKTVIDPMLVSLWPPRYESFMRRLYLCIFLILTAGPAAAATLACGGTVAPGLAYPDVNGHWSGLEIQLCGKLADMLHETPLFTPILQDSDTPGVTKAPSVLFLPQGDIPAGYAPGPVIFNDNQAIMVPAGSPAHDAADLTGDAICVEPGSPEDFNLADYFAAHKLLLHKFVFQETDEMHDAYVAGRCDAITARRTLLIGLRANEDGARRDDVILPDNLGNNPIRVASPASLPAFTALVASTIKESQNVP